MIRNHRAGFWLGLLGVTVLLQTILLSIAFPLSLLLSDLPILHIDAPMHWYRMVTAVNLAHDGNLIGYDPFFGAGARTGVVSNPAGKVAALMALVLNGWVDEVVVWKLYSVAASLIAVVCVPIALRLVGASRTAILIGTVFGLLLWWVSMFRWFHTAGLVSFVLASYLGLPYMGMIVRYLRGAGGNWSLVFLGVAGAVLFLLHPLFPVPIMFGTIAYLAFNWNTQQWRRVLPLLTVVPAISLLPNLIYLYPMFTASDPAINTTPHQAVVDASIVWKELLGIWQDNAHGSKLYSLFAFATVCALLLTGSGRERRLLVAMSATGASLVAYATFGGSVGMLAFLTQPNRFAPVGYLWLIIPASIGTARLLAIAASGPRGWSGRGVWASLGVIVAITSVSGYELQREVSHGDHGRYGAQPPRVKALGAYSTTILQWLDQYTDQSARILFETSNGRIHDGGHMAPYYAYQSRREFIGGAYPHSHFAGFWDGFLFGQPVSDLEDEEFSEYAELYNLGWIIVFSRDSRQVFDRMPGVEPLADFQDLKLYRINRPHSYFLSGEGQVTVRAHNRLVLENVRGDSVTIKYHFIEGLTSEPALSIEPVMFLDDPTPFIRILNPPAELVFRLD